MRRLNRRQWLQTVVVGGIGGVAANLLPIPAWLSSAQVAQAAPASSSLAQNITQAATTFLAGLQDAQRARATYAFDNSERLRWHWTTPAGFPRNGLPLKEMTADQKKLAFALLQTSISEYG